MFLVNSCELYGFAGPDYVSIELGKEIKLKKAYSKEIYEKKWVEEWLEKNAKNKAQCRAEQLNSKVILYNQLIGELREYRGVGLQADLAESLCRRNLVLQIWLTHQWDLMDPDHYYQVRRTLFRLTAPTPKALEFGMPRMDLRPQAIVVSGVSCFSN
jgi:hypothetical protein